MPPATELSCSSDISDILLLYAWISSVSEMEKPAAVASFTASAALAALLILLLSSSFSDIALKKSSIHIEEIEENILLASFSSGLPNRVHMIRRESRPKRHRR